MRRPNRNIEIFSLSVLDLFSAAMGAFIIVSLVLFPYYLRTQQADKAIDGLSSQLAQCRQEGNETQAKAADAAAAAAQAKDKLQACQAESASTFIVAVMRWETDGYDVDLHVVDPAGHVYFFGKRQYGNSDDPYDPQLSYDNTWGPGIEIWQNPRAAAGSYCLAVHLYNYSAAMHPDPAIRVDGRIFFRNDMKDVPAVTLTKANPYVRVGTAEIGRDGKLKFHPGRWACATDTAPTTSPGGSLSQGGGGKRAGPRLR